MPDILKNLGTQKSFAKTMNEDAGGNPNQTPVPDSELDTNTFKGNNTPESYTPNSEGKTNTGSGAEAALGTDFSWNKSGAEKAQTQFKVDVNTAKTTAQENATTINQNLATAQEQSDMMKYQNNQEAEKVGWTGGYVLDQNRQAEYLKASLNAQMYGAIELQKYGYDTSLAAARLSYDLNQQEYAKQYYQEAVTNALNESQVTGVYFSAETKDMMAQYSIASQKLNSGQTSEAEKESAQQIMDNIDTWFDANGISKEGVKTLAAWQADQNNELSWQNEIWTEYQAALQTAQAAIDDNATAFIRYNADGIEYKNGEVQTIDMSGLSKEELKKYADSGDKPKEQVAAYYQYKAEQLKADNTKYNKDGNLTGYDIEAIKEGLKEINTDNKYATGNKEDILVDGWTKDPITGEYKPTNIEEQKANTIGGYVYKSATYNDDGTLKEAGSTVDLIDSKSTIKGLSGSGKDDDVDLNIGDGLGNGDKNYNYDIDIDWTYSITGWDSTKWYAIVAGVLTNGISTALDAATEGISDNTYKKETWNEVQKKLNAGYPNAKNGSLALAEDTVWIYYNGTWGFVQQTNAGGSRLKEDLNTYASGITPDRWKK